MLSSRQSIFDAIEQERERQDALHGEVNANVHPLDFRWLAVVNKTAGDASAALLFARRLSDGVDQTALEDVRKNLIQVAASAVQAIERLDAYDQSTR